MVKRLGIFLFIILMFTSLVSCSGGSYSILVGEIDSSRNEISGDYNGFTGHYFKQVKMKEGEMLEVTFSADTEKGELIAKVIDASGNTIKTLKTGEKTTLAQPGQYKMQVEGEKHTGNFTLAWKQRWKQRDGSRAS